METVKHAKTSNKLPASARIMDNTFFCFCTSLCSKSSWLARSHSLCLSSLIRAVCVLVPGALAYGKISWCFDNPQELVCRRCSALCSPKSGQTSVLFKSSSPTALKGLEKVIHCVWFIRMWFKKNIYETEWDEISKMLGKYLWKV